MLQLPFLQFGADKENKTSFNCLFNPNKLGSRPFQGFTVPDSRGVRNQKGKGGKRLVRHGQEMKERKPAHRTRELPASSDPVKSESWLPNTYSQGMKWMVKKKTLNHFLTLPLWAHYFLVRSQTRQV
jgi:hypothetical protein